MAPGRRQGRSVRPPGSSGPRPRRAGRRDREAATGSRQPNSSPDDSPPRAIEASSAGIDSHVSSSVREATSRLFQSRGGRYVDGQSFGSSPAATSSARRSSAWLHRNSAASAMSPGSSRTRSVPGSTWSSPVAGARWAAQTSAASPTSIARLCGGVVSRRARSSGCDRPSPSNRSRSAASRSRKFAAAAQSRADRGDAAGRQQEFGRRQEHGRGRLTPTCAGRSGRRRGASRSRRRRTRSGRGAAASAGRRRRSRRAAPNSPRPATSVTGT